LRAGAVIEEEGGSTSVKFSEEALRNFYLADALLHEIGHHVDRPNDRWKSLRKSERFAEWFASEHGFPKRTRQ
jgi:predicted HD phosphohydrolase